MRWGFIIAAVLVLAVPGARGQVSVNMNALDSLAPALAPAPGAGRSSVPQSSTIGGAGAARAMPPRLPPFTGPLPLPPIPPAGPVPPAPQFATVGRTTIGPLPAPPPAQAPAKPVLAPIVLVGPPHPEPMPPPPHVVDGAPGRATHLPDGLRITFGADGAALNPATLAALREAASAAVNERAPAVAVDAYAKSDPSDPSTARRLSLSRALAAQAVLREAGIPSERIYVRALLAEAGPAPVNRVDVMFKPGGQASPAQGTPQGTPTGTPQGAPQGTR
jgi:OmpA family